MIRGMSAPFITTFLGVCRPIANLFSVVVSAAKTIKYGVCSGGCLQACRTYYCGLKLPYYAAHVTTSWSQMTEEYSVQ